MVVKMLPTSSWKTETEEANEAHCEVRVEGYREAPQELVGSGGPLVMLRGNPLEQLLTQSQPAWSCPSMELVRWSSIFG